MAAWTVGACGFIQIFLLSIPIMCGWNLGTPHICNIRIEIQLFFLLFNFAMFLITESLHYMIFTMVLDCIYTSLMGSILELVSILGLFLLIHFCTTYVWGSKLDYKQHISQANNKVGFGCTTTSELYTYANICSIHVLFCKPNRLPVQPILTLNSSHIDTFPRFPLGPVLTMIYLL